MESSLIIRYDQEGDILHIDKRKPYAGQDSDEIGEEMIARFNPDTGEVENIEILFFTARLRKDPNLELPLSADLRLAV